MAAPPHPATSPAPSTAILAGSSIYSFADDKQLFASAPVAEAHEAKKTMERCVAAIKDWCASRRLKLNDGKTEVIWLGTRPRLQQLAGVDLNLSVGSDTIIYYHQLYG